MLWPSGMLSQKLQLRPLRSQWPCTNAARVQLASPEQAILRKLEKSPDTFCLPKGKPPNSKNLVVECSTWLDLDLALAFIMLRFNSFVFHLLLKSSFVPWCLCERLAFWFVLLAPRQKNLTQRHGGTKENGCEPEDILEDPRSPSKQKFDVAHQVRRAAPPLEFLLGALAPS